MSKEATKPNPVGRPPRDKPRRAITVRLEPEDAERFREVCAINDRSQSKQIEAWIRACPTV